MIFHEFLSIRIDLSILSMRNLEHIPQTNDIFDFHYLNYNMIGEFILHNLLRDEDIALYGVED